MIILEWDNYLSTRREKIKKSSILLLSSNRAQHGIIAVNVSEYVLSPNREGNDWNRAELVNIFIVLHKNIK